MTLRAQTHPVLGAADALTASLLLFAVWGALPARWWPIDLGVTVLAVLLFISGLALSIGTSWARGLGIFSSALVLVAGCSLVSGLAVTATEMAGLYGPVGRGASIILWIVFFLLVPYLILLPTTQLFVLLGERRDAPSP